MLPLLLAALLTLSACGGSGQQGAAPSGGGTAAGTKPAQKVTIRLAHEQAATHYLTKYVQQYADEVKQKSGGNVEIQVFPSGQLYKDADSIQQISGGGLEMGMSLSSYISALVPPYRVLDLPFVNPDGSFAGMQKLVDPKGPLGPELDKAAAAKNVKVLGWFQVGRWPMFNTKRPVHKLEDMKGLKVRVVGGAPQEKAMEALGGSPATVAAPELVTSIKTGTIDGMIATYFFWSSSLSDVKYGIEVPGLYSNFLAVTINKPFYDKLPPETQQLLTDAFATVSKQEADYVASLDEKAIADLKGKGVDVYLAPADEIARWRQAVQPVYKTMEGQIGADIINKALSTQKP